MDDLFWEEFESDFEDYAASRQNKLTDRELAEEKQFAEQLLGR